jgi:ABC-type polysaccharide transport system permease subunit
MLALKNIFYFLVLSIIIAVVVSALTKSPFKKQVKHGLIVFGQLVGGVIALTVVVYLLSR